MEFRRKALQLALTVSERDALLLIQFDNISSCTVPAVWGTATIEPSISSQPTEGYMYTYLCSIVLNVDLEATPELVWVGPDGDPVAISSKIVIGQTETVGRETSLALNYVPLNSTHGGNYSCEVSVQVPYLNVTLSKLVRKTLVVTSKLMGCIQ